MQHPTSTTSGSRAPTSNLGRDRRSPALNITGWWDMNFPGAPLNFEAMREGATPEAPRRPEARHRPVAALGQPAAQLQRRRLRRARDDRARRLHHPLLRPLAEGHRATGSTTRSPSTSSCSARTSGGPRTTGRCRAPSRCRSTSTRGGDANSLKGDGGLSTEPPGDEPADAYRYDPRDPVRIALEAARRPGRRPAPVDPRRRALLHERAADRAARRRRLGDDARSTRRRRRATPTGTCGSSTSIRTAARASSATACLRARFRESFEQPELLEPGEPYLFEFTMDACGIRFLPGHRIRVEVTSSWFTQYDRNTNSGAENNFTRRPAGRGRPDASSTTRALLARRPAGDPAVT